ncbi:MAG: ribonuclease HII [Clostridia bacterium]|nr:ribonuclease HII [Clostridia bacterium]
MLTDTYEKEMGGIVCGVDEAGRGPLVGRVYAAAVILPPLDEDNEVFQALNDSKKLTEKKRFALAPKIKELAVAYCVAYSEVAEIEEFNILEASLLAMRRSISGLSVKPDNALIDGNISRDFDKVNVKARAIVGGDGISLSIAAASILAKTERDIYCMEYLDNTYPEYGFAKHKGYGTKDHYAAIDKYGPCPEHRMSFLKKYFERKNDT